MPTYNGRKLGSTDYRKSDVLEWLYWKEELSTRDIAEIFDVHKDTVRRWMDKNDVDARDRIEASKAKLDGGIATLQYHNGRYVWAHHYNGERDYVKVARLLAVAEYGFDAVSDMVVHHKNGIKWLDYPNNIELLTEEEHGKLHNTGSNHPQTDLTEATVKEIKKRVNHYEYKELAEMFDVTESKVADIAQENSWAHVSVDGWS